MLVPSDQSAPVTCHVALVFMAGLHGGNEDQSSDGCSWQMFIARVYQPLIVDTEGAGEPHTLVYRVPSYSGVGSGSPGFAHLPYVSPCWARSKGDNGGLMKNLQANHDYTKQHTTTE